MRNRGRQDAKYMLLTVAYRDLEETDRLRRERVSERCGELGRDGDTTRGGHGLVNTRSCTLQLIL